MYGNKKHMYIIEGNIGAGKSTFLKLTTQHLLYLSEVPEPQHNWQKQVYGQSLLANFYHTPHRWAYTTETLTMICRFKEHIREQANNNDQAIPLIERSIYSGHYCFAKNGYLKGYMTDLEWSIYNEWFTFLIPKQCQPPQGFIYLKVSPEIAYQRIKKRNRLTEKEITLSYLRQIEQRHEEFLINKENLLPELQRVPVLIIDCNKEFETNEKQLLQHIEAVDAFIKSRTRSLFFKTSSNREEPCTL